MTQRLGLLVFAAICGLAAMLLMQVYIKSKTDALKNKYRMVSVVTAKTDIPVGTVLTQENKAQYLGLDSELARTFTSDMITEDKLEIVMNQKFRHSVVARSKIKWSDFEEERSRGGSLAMMVPENERAVSIPVDLTSSVTGLVEPNDHVDILGTFTFPSMKGDPQLDTVTMTVLQNVTVVATGRETSKSLLNASIAGTAQRSGAYSTVTLLVTPKEAEMLVFAMQKGKLTLTLRNPADVSSAKELGNINFNYLERKIGEFNDIRQERLRRGVPTQ